MKNFNWLIKALFYQHTETTATRANTTAAGAIFYDVGYCKQEHANMCTDACDNMLAHFAGKPIASMTKNPRKALEPGTPKLKRYQAAACNISDFQNILREKGPFMLGIPLRYGISHAIVVTGFSNNKIIYHDPLTKSNQLLSLDELQRINGGQENVGILTLKDFPKDKLKPSNTLPESPKVLSLGKYSTFFTTEKMETPCNAVRKFLLDYTRSSLFTNRKHQAKVDAFLKNWHEIKSIKTLAEKLHDALAPDARSTNGELLKRLQAIEKVLNKSITHDDTPRPDII